MTAFCGAEALINSRPLTFLSPQTIFTWPQFAPEALDELGLNPKKRWQRIQALVRQFWNRWLHEWESGLN